MTYVATFSLICGSRFTRSSEKSEDVDGIMVEGLSSSGEVDMETRRPCWEGVERRCWKAVVREEDAAVGCG